jgi:phage terminase large subunit-like protein
MSVCEACGREFEQAVGQRGRPRKQCLECSPRRGVAPVARRMRRPRGEAFTVEHFAGWSQRLLLASGERFRLEAFQASFVEDVFAGTKECWLVVPESNGKTTLLALIALYHCEHRAEAWVPVAAASRDQAGLMYRQASGFVLRNPELAGVFKCHPGYRRIFYEALRSSIQIFAADASTGDGIIPTLAIIDEPHRHKNLDLYRTWAGKLDKADAQLLAISTAGEPGGEFELLREQFRQTAVDVSVDGCFTRALGAGSVLHEWALPEDGDPEDLDLVAAANPLSLITVATLRSKRAQPSWTLAHWRRFVCNLPTRSVLAAITEREWAAAATEDQIPDRTPIWCGLDVAWKWDTTALVPLWWKSDDYRLLGPATILEPPRDGNSLDPGLVERALLELHARWPLHTVVMDPSKAEQLAQWISDTLGARVVERAQTNAFAVVDYAKWMEALRMGWLHHAGDPGLSRHVLNATARLLPGGDSRFDRPAEARRSGEQPRRVIDALTAASMVHSEAALAGVVGGGISWWDDATQARLEALDAEDGVAAAMRRMEQAGGG